MQSLKTGNKGKKPSQSRGASGGGKKNTPAMASKKVGSAKARSKNTPVAEQSIGIRICALAMVLLLVLASASYVPTQPLLIFIYALAALAGSYLSYAFRNDRPRWISIPPFAGAVLLFANFIFELNFALYAGHAGAVSATAVTAFVHMLSGLLALHCFDLRTRGDFSVSALIGLGLLTFLTGVASRDWIFGAYVLIYTILGGMLLFYDSSSRSHEMGPSRAMQDGGAGGQATNYLDGQPIVRRLRIASVTAMLPIFIIPFATAALSFVLPKGDSMLELVVSSFRAQFPLSANMSGYLSRGGSSQSSKGGVSPDKKEGGSSYSAKGGQGDGTASSAGPPGGKTGNSAGSGGRTGANAQGGANNPKGKGPLQADINGKKNDVELSDVEKQAQNMQRAREQQWQNEAVDLHSAQNDQEALVLQVASENPTYVRRYTLDVFDERGWSRKMPTAGKVLDKSKAGFDLTSSDAVYVPPDLPTEEVTQEFRAETNLGSFLPHTWMPQVVKIADEEVQIDGDGALKLSAPLPDHMRYSVTSQVPVYDLEVMRRLPSETLLQLDDERVDELKTAEACLQLPKGLDKRIQSMADDAGGIEGNWFSKAERTVEYIKSHYHYNKISFYDHIQKAAAAPATASAAASVFDSEPKPAPKPEPPVVVQNINNYSGTWGATTGNTTAKPAPPAPAAPKAPVAEPVAEPVETPQTAQAQRENELAALNEFLFESKRGNCRHFASTFAILCRAQGIPSRLVVGFLPGELNKKTGYREVRGKETHVWAEIYVPYWNWVPFDPTPNGKLPAHQEGGNALTKFIASGLANPFGQTTNRKTQRKQSSMQGGGNNQSHHDEKKIDGPKLNFDGAKNKPKGSNLNLPWLGNIEQGQMQTIFKVISVLLFLLIGTVAVLVYLRQRKKAEVQQLIGEQQPSTVVFLEVLSDLKRFEFTKLPTETADELSDRARTQFARLSSDGRQIPRELPEVVSEFMRLYTEERFGGSDNLGELHELSRQIKALSQVKVGK